MRKLSMEALEARELFAVDVVTAAALLASSASAPAAAVAPQLAATAQVGPQAAATRDPAYWPFSSDSPWNTPLGNGAKYDRITASAFNYNGPATIGITQWSWPVFIGNASDPIRNFYSGDGKLVGSLRTPAAATPDSRSDGSMIVIDSVTGEAVEMWRASKRSNGDWQASAAANTDLESTGFYSRYHGVRAGGMSAIGGLVRKEELQNLNIPHAVALAINKTIMNKNTPSGKAWVWPASWADGMTESTAGSSYTGNGNVYMGSLLALDPNVDITKLGLSPQGLAFARALQNYGGYITEQGTTNLGFYAEAAAASVAESNLAAQLTKLVPHIRVVSNNSPTAVGGGGDVRRAPAAPPLGTETTPVPNPTPTPVQMFDVNGMVQSRGLPVAGARVMVIHTATAKLVRTLITDSTGRYLVNDLAPGEYTFRISKTGFRTTWFQVVSVTEDQEPITDLFSPR
jgi:hypothetical protein